MICENCMHFSRCFERRGKCSSFKTLEEVREEIERINKTYRTGASEAREELQKAALQGHGRG